MNSGQIQNRKDVQSYVCYLNTPTYLSYQGDDNTSLGFEVVALGVTNLLLSFIHEFSRKEAHPL